MNRIISSLLAATLSASFAATAALPAGAAQMFTPQAPSASSDVQAVDYKPWMRHRNFNGDRNFSRSNSDVYWNGHRGSRHYRHGYRRHGDFWFPAGAFIAGALITGAIANNQHRVYRGGDAHVQWCYDRYRSYRASDNTYQPNYGPRRQCNSPY